MLLSPFDELLALSQRGEVDHGFSPWSPEGPQRRSETAPQFNSGRPLRIVYVSYDGLEDPLGRSQIRPYVEGLARLGHSFEIVSFEKTGTELRFRQPLAEGIGWTALRYHRGVRGALRLPVGSAVTGLLSLLHSADLFHVRSQVAAMLALPWVMATRIPLLFDTRGLWPDEKVDVGAWTRGGWTHRAAKRAERLLYRRAAGITVLTRSMQDYLRRQYPYRHEIQAPIHVIPTCVDLDRFSLSVPPEPAMSECLGESRVLAYTGSLGTWYMENEMARFYLAWRSALRASAGSCVQTRFLLISRSDPMLIREILARQEAASELVHRPADHAEVPALLRCAEAAICFISPAFSKRGSCPTKLGETLACGLPVVANLVGDMETILEGSPAATLVRDMSEDSLMQAAHQLIKAVTKPQLGLEARRLAEKWFSLEEGVQRYDSIYRSLPRFSRLNTGGSP